MDMTSSGVTRASNQLQGGKLGQGDEKNITVGSCVIVLVTQQQPEVATTVVPQMPSCIALPLMTCCMFISFGTKMFVWKPMTFSIDFTGSQSQAGPEFYL